MATATRPESTTFAPIAPLDDFVPPSGDILFEVIDDVVVECPPMGNREVDLANRLIEWMMMHVVPQEIGRVFSEPLFRLRKESTHRRRPDIAFITSEKWPRNQPLPEGNAWEMVPDLAVEVVSPSDQAAELDRKIVEYFEAGVALAWLIYPVSRRVYVYTSATEARILTAAEELDGGAVIPGFRLPLARLFDGDPDPTSA